MDEKLRAIAEAFERELRDWPADAVIGAGVTSADVQAATVGLVADEFHQRGVPVCRGRLEGDAIVFDVAVPRGVG